jgi:undecaprenyl-phosphate 4-deoxy-4-formamido-L-arabinose transferase
MMAEPEISVIIPVYNEEECLPELLQRMAAAMAGMGRPYEIICINDGSRDGSLKILTAASAADPSLKIIDFNRNYGQHSAVFAGFEAARGEIIITLDADLQNPPEEVPKLVAKMDEGYDVVGSVRQQRQDSLFRKIASRIINRVTAAVTGVQLHDYGCMLRAYRKDVVKTLCEAKEISTFIPVLADLFAGRVTEIPVAHAERTKGQSKYSVLKLIRLQFDLITSFSLLPLRTTMFVGVITSILAMAVAIVLITGRLIYGSDWALSGTFTLFAVLFFFMGILLFSIGLLGEYVGRIYMEVRNRPRFVIRRVIMDGKERHP